MKVHRLWATLGWVVPLWAAAAGCSPDAAGTSELQVTFQVDGTVSTAEITHTGAGADHPAGEEHLLYQARGTAPDHRQDLHLVARFTGYTEADTIRCRIFMDARVVAIQHATGPNGSVTCTYRSAT